MEELVRARKDGDRARCTHSLEIAERGGKSVNGKKATEPGARTFFRPQREERARTRNEKREYSQTRDTEGRLTPC